jgi:UDP-N-acetylglucosamine 2-epimerase (non-hydrolysing)
MKHIISVVGARPNFMKVAPIHRAFSTHHNKTIQHSICHTGQHYDSKMSDAFFQDLDMPDPRYFLGIGGGSHAEQTARIMVEFEKVLLSEKPDMVLVVGDVNSTIACSLSAKKLHIPVAHVEAGLRSFDRTMPEEINRIATDAITDYFFITEQSGLDHLRKEGHSEDELFFVGNTMIDSLHYALPKAKQSTIQTELGLDDTPYVLMTIHRPSNVDDPTQLEILLNIFAKLSEHRKVVFPVHPRTRKNIEQSNLASIIADKPNIKLIEPQGYISFLSLMMNADFVMTDSGGIQEETTALGVPCITLRTTTERPSTVDIGTNILIQPTKNNILSAIDDVIAGKKKTGSVPPLWDGKASERIASIISEILLK